MFYNILALKDAKRQKSASRSPERYPPWDGKGVNPAPTILEHERMADTFRIYRDSDSEADQENAGPLKPKHIQVGSDRRTQDMMDIQARLSNLEAMAQTVSEVQTQQGRQQETIERMARASEAAKEEQRKAVEALEERIRSQAAEQVARHDEVISQQGVANDALAKIMAKLNLS